MPCCYSLIAIPVVAGTFPACTPESRYVALIDASRVFTRTGKVFEQMLLDLGNALAKKQNTTKKTSGKAGYSSGAAT